MKKLFLISSLLLSTFNIRCSSSNSLYYPMMYDYYSEEVSLTNLEKSIVSIIDSDNFVIGSGLIFEIDGSGVYIMTSCHVSQKTEHFEIVFSDLQRIEATNIGYTENECLGVLKSVPNDNQNIEKIKYINSDFLNHGNGVYMISNSLYNDYQFMINKGIISNIGSQAKNFLGNDFFATVVSIDSNSYNLGGAIFNELGLISGIVVDKEFGDDDSIVNKMTYSININEALRIANNIKNTGQYNRNEFNFDIISLSSLNLYKRQYYGVYEGATSGAVILTFSPFKYLFGGINQGMVIVEINGSKVNNSYDVHQEIIKYQSGDKLELKLINNKGKTLTYNVKI